MGHTTKFGIYYPDSTEPREIPGDFEEMYPTVDPLIAVQGLTTYLPIYGQFGPPPFKGQVIEYANSNVDPTYSWNWRLVYDPDNSPAHPWRYLGGAPIEIESEVGVNVYVAAGGWKLDPVLQFPIPWEGDWNVEAQISCTNPSAGTGYTYASFSRVTPLSAFDTAWEFRGDVNYQTISHRRRYNLDDGPHGMVYVTNATDHAVVHRTLRIWPIAIGDHDYPDPRP